MLSVGLWAGIQICAMTTAGTSNSGTKGERGGEGRRKGPAGNYQHGQDWGKGACLVWSGGAEGNLATSPQLLKCSYRVSGVRLFLPISNSSQTKESHNARFRSGIGKPSLPRAGAALGQAAQRGQGISLLWSF